MKLKKILNERELENRASTVVADFFFRRLIVPQVYIDVPWPKPDDHVAVLARDRAGTGDIHVAEIIVLQGNVGQALKLPRVLSKLAAIPAHYKYLAVFSEPPRLLMPKEHALYDSSGFGRIGVIRLSEDDADNLKPELLVAPERFRPSPEIFRRADRLLARRSPDFEIRD